MKVKNISLDNFDEVVMQASGKVLIDFWASWCAPCRMLSPVVDEIAQERKDVTVCKVNIDAEEALARKFQVMSIPTLVVMENGKVIEKSVGVVPKQKIESML